MSNFASTISNNQSQISFFKKQNLLLSFFRILIGITLMIVCANITIPLKPVPITLQTVAVMLIGLTYLPVEALISCVSYMILGAIGLPVFSNFQFGLSVLSGPAGGYLVGMALAGFFVAHTNLIMRNYFSNLSANIVSCTIGTTIIYVCGVLWLSSFIGMEKAIYTGFIVFLPSGVCKILLISYILRLVGKF